MISVGNGKYFHKVSAQASHIFSEKRQKKTRKLGTAGGVPDSPSYISNVFWKGDLLWERAHQNFPGWRNGLCGKHLTNPSVGQSKKVLREDKSAD